MHAVAAHEGQLFGLINQLLGHATAMGLVLLCMRAVVLWWRRRQVGVIGAPLPNGKPRWPVPLFASVLVLALYLPQWFFSECNDCFGETSLVPYHGNTALAWSGFVIA